MPISRQDVGFFYGCNMADFFDRAIAKLFELEGGYVNDKDDPGGETKYGISQKAYPNLDIKSLTKQDAINIYRCDYWDKGRFSLIANYDIALFGFVLGVNCGVRVAVRTLQQAWNLLHPDLKKGLDEDGIMGTKTANAVNTYKHPKALRGAYRHEAQDYYINCKKPKYLAGWFNRLEKLN